MRWRYHYPQRAFPYADLVADNARRGRDEPEYELVDTGVFDDDRYWAVTVDYAKAAPPDMCMRVTVTNRGPDEATLHVLPTLWFRNTWAWGLPGSRTDVPADPRRRRRRWSPSTGRWDGSCSARRRRRRSLLFCDNETNAQRLWGVAGRSPYPKDGINDHLVHGAADGQPGPGRHQGGRCTTC